MQFQKKRIERLKAVHSSPVPVKSFVFEMSHGSVAALPLFFVRVMSTVRIVREGTRRIFRYAAAELWLTASLILVTPCNRSNQNLPLQRGPALSVFHSIKPPFREAGLMHTHQTRTHFSTIQPHHPGKGHIVYHKSEIAKKQKKSGKKHTHFFKLINYRANGKHK